MTKPSNFTLSSDYATLKNDATGTLSVTLPSGVVIPAATVYTQTDTISIGTPGASYRSRVNSTKRTQWLISKSIIYSYSSGATIPPSVSVNYDIFVSIVKQSSTQVVLRVSIPNAYTDPMTVSGLAQTVTAHVATFLPPF